jgi:hypothetical protein
MMFVATFMATQFNQIYQGFSYIIRHNAFS